eukprot:923206-Amphidinium_carterae.1
MNQMLMGKGRKASVDQIVELVDILTVNKQPGQRLLHAVCRVSRPCCSRSMSNAVSLHECDSIRPFAVSPRSHPCLSQCWRDQNIDAFVVNPAVCACENKNIDAFVVNPAVCACENQTINAPVVISAVCACEINTIDASVAISAVCANENHNIGTSVTISADCAFENNINDTLVASLAVCVQENRTTCEVPVYTLTESLVVHNRDMGQSHRYWQPDLGWGSL